MRILTRISFASLLALTTPALGVVVERASQPLITPAPVIPNILQKRDVVTWGYVSGDSSELSLFSTGHTGNGVLMYNRFPIDMSIRLYHYQQLGHRSGPHVMLQFPKLYRGLPDMHYKWTTRLHTRCKMFCALCV